jgi:hypothetical protein
MSDVSWAPTDAKSVSINPTEAPNYSQQESDDRATRVAYVAPLPSYAPVYVFSGWLYSDRMPAPQEMQLVAAFENTTQSGW